MTEPCGRHLNDCLHKTHTQTYAHMYIYNYIYIWYRVYIYICAWVTIPKWQTFQVGDLLHILSIFFPPLPREYSLKPHQTPIEPWFSREPSQVILVGGLEHLDYFSIYWECHHPFEFHIFQRVGWNHQPAFIFPEKYPKYWYCNKTNHI